MNSESHKMLFEIDRISRSCVDNGGRASFLVMFGPSLDPLEPFPAVLEHRKRRKLSLLSLDII